jgi:hypothetical protein
VRGARPRSAARSRPEPSRDAGHSSSVSSPRSRSAWRRRSRSSRASPAARPFTSESASRSSVDSFSNSAPQ